MNGGRFLGGSDADIVAVTIDRDGDRVIVCGSFVTVAEVLVQCKE